MKTLTTVCARDCYDTCSLLVTLDDAGKIVSIKGDPQHPITRGFTCPRGAKDHERLYRNRIETPYLRQGKEFKSVDWDTALDLLARKLADTLHTRGPEAVLTLNYAGNCGLLTNVFPQRLWYALGASHTDYAICSKSGHTGLQLHYGQSYGIMPDELATKRLIVFWGFNAAVSAPHIWALARKARQRSGAKLVVIDPIKTRTAEQADLWIQPRPGSDTALVYGLINVLIQKSYIDADFITDWTVGFDYLKDEATKWTPKRVEKITGVSWQTVEQLGELYHSARPGVTMIGIGLQKRNHGADQVRAISFIPALLGLHRGFFYSNGRAFLVNEALLMGETFITKSPKIVEQVALADYLQQGVFGFLYVSCMNPALTLPNQQAFRAGLLREDVFVAVHDTHWTKTATHADIVLPAPTYLEKEDLVLPWTHPYCRYSPQLIAPVTDSRSEVWVMRALATRLGLKEPWLYEDPWEAIEQAAREAFEDGGVESLRAGKLLTLKRKPAEQYATASGKIEFSSSHAEALGFSQLPSQLQLENEEGTFILLASASVNYTSTQFQEVYGPIPAVITMYPPDAERLGITEGQEVNVSNTYGSVRMTVTLSENVPEGVLWAPRQSEGLNGAPQNCLTSSAPQQIGHGPRFNSTRVSITL